MCQWSSVYIQSYRNDTEQSWPNNAKRGIEFFRPKQNGEHGGIEKRRSRMEFLNVSYKLWVLIFVIVIVVVAVAAVHRKCVCAFFLRGFHFTHSTVVVCSIVARLLSSLLLFPSVFSSLRYCEMCKFFRNGPYFIATKNVWIKSVIDHSPHRHRHRRACVVIQCRSFFLLSCC